MISIPLLISITSPRDSWPADSNGNASVHDGLDDQIPVGCFLRMRADDQECLLLGHVLTVSMHNALMLLSIH